MKLRHASLLLPVLLASPVQAQGFNLSWNDCAGFGQSVATFACNTNAGANRLFASFVPPNVMAALVGVEVYVDVWFNQATVPSWWLTNSPSGCRSGAMTPNAYYVGGPSNCVDPWSGLAVQAATTDPGFPSSNRMRLRGIAVVPSPVAATVDPESEYYALDFRIGRLRTVGAACTGCEVAACLQLTLIRLLQPAGFGDADITQPLVNPVVGWQCPAFYGTPSPVCFQCPVPAKSRTWGAVKGFYR